MDLNAKISMISVIIMESFWNQSTTKCLEDIQIFHGNQAIVVTCSELRENDVVVYKNKEIGTLMQMKQIKSSLNKRMLRFGILLEINAVWSYHQWDEL